MDAGLGPTDADAWTERIALLGHLAAWGLRREARVTERREWPLRFPGLGLDAPPPTPALLAELLADPPHLALLPPTPDDRAQVAARLVPLMTGPARPLRVFDPACGDGARLEAAFDRLVGWHWESSGSPPDLDQARRLARACLHGWDPSPTQRLRAQLRLGLRALDGAAPDLVARSVTLFSPGLLPDLGANLASEADPPGIAGGWDVVLRG